ncbi:glycosyltransferase family 4 protein [Entomobacter blattae]|uniref:Glycosyltransferase EpsD n=1 Tax=Entomobacter blattae TaxID=2762277 RepID=A0A7H1NQR3_9PROT|nr:glycosyltransferase family 4 protein [Entomobacter blattae]QNT78123.1 Putative glycosyltransferase EpsD [Entomobacter blattae]
MKILEIANVDFSLKQFVLPLMKQLRQQGCEVIGASADGPLLSDLRKEGFKVVALPLSRSYSPWRNIQAFMALVQLMRKEKPDIVHAHMPISGILARWAAKLTGVPVIAYTGHGFLFNQPGPCFRRALSFVLEWLTGKITDIYFTVSSEEAEQARRFYIHRHTRAIGNGRDPHCFHPDIFARRDIRKQLQVKDDDVVVVMVSRLVRHKGYPELFAAMQHVPEALLWIVGEKLPSDHGEDLTEVFVDAEKTLGKRLRLLGYRNDVPAVLAAADIFVLPSLFEGLPMSVIEAMLTGLPVVASDIKGCRQLVKNGVTGLLVPPGDSAGLANALNELVQSSQKRNTMGLAGLKEAFMRYNEKNILKNTASRLLSKGSKTR